ncbi:hypothetical protein NNJEOMEG_03218 [Fundidesulfovibrio magnetotacticus]|uniref:Mce/MlaD domain-containing protein n=1 Tax=Fundidesulfovibrio magnetotacticus TaxID=2730080 RepID=A0A6V8LZZ7_9BACT|nr:MlaD family protein [Fundidesulfovibrio magnetotacticus]GFK95356.1 hypothetical protein NNJEOMEG_03218 [Fundidesulfovibrio magnetotacticus]
MFTKNAKSKDTLKASLAIAACLAVLGTFVVILGGYRFWERQELYSALFRSVKDLSAGRPVKYGGLDVGRVLSVGVDQDDARLIRVTLGLAPDAPIRQGVVARIAQKGLVGDYYVFLEPVGELGARLPQGSTIPTVESVDMTQLANLAGELIADLRPRLDRIAGSLETIFGGENAARISELLSKSPALIDELNGTVKQIRKDFQQLTAGGKTAAENVSRLAGSLEQAVNSLKTELEKTLADIRIEVKSVGDTAGTLNKAVRHDQERLEDILANVDRISEDLKQLSSRLRERPWELIQRPTERKP